MVVIRLSRGGAKKRPFYQIVVCDKRSARDGRCVERIGYFNPIAAGQEKRLHLEYERALYWIATGAQPSDRVRHLIKTYEQQAKTKTETQQ
jgi:small subunit ribosomal protein S16